MGGIQSYGTCFPKGTVRCAGACFPGDGGNWELPGNWGNYRLSHGTSHQKKKKDGGMLGSIVTFPFIFSLVPPPVIPCLFSFMLFLISTLNV